MGCLSSKPIECKVAATTPEQQQYGVHRPIPIIPKLDVLPPAEVTNLDTQEEVKEVPITPIPKHPGPKAETREAKGQTSQKPDLETLPLGRLRMNMWESETPDEEMWELSPAKLREVNVRTQSLADPEKRLAEIPELETAAIYKVDQYVNNSLSLDQEGSFLESIDIEAYDLQSKNQQTPMIQITIDPADTIDEETPTMNAVLPHIEVVDVGASPTEIVGPGKTEDKVSELRTSRVEVVGSDTLQQEEMMLPEPSTADKIKSEAAKADSEESLMETEKSEVLAEEELEASKVKQMEATETNLLNQEESLHPINSEHKLQTVSPHESGNK